MRFGIGSTGVIVGAIVAVGAMPVHAAVVRVGCDPVALQAAIDAANTAGTGKIKLMRNCVYAAFTPSTETEAFPVITGTITITGQVSKKVGKTTVLARDPGAAGPFRLFQVAPGGTLTLKKMALYNGVTPGLGGAILVNGTLNMASTTVADNTAGNGGGVAIAAGGTATITKGNFVLNTTTGVGGGALINSGTLTLAKSRIVNNFGPINGGGINTQPGGVTTILRTIFLQNRSGGLGGSLSNLGTTDMKRSTVTGNTGSAGGAIATGNTQVTLDKNEIANNNPDNCSPLNTIDGCID